MRLELIAALTSSLACAACDGGRVLAPPWPSDAQVVLLIVGAALEPAESSPRVIAGSEPIVLAAASDGEPRRVRARVFAAASETARDLASCGATYGGPGRALPAPDQAWRLDVTADPSWAEDLDPPPADLRLGGGCAKPARTLCDETGLTAIPTRLGSFDAASAVDAGGAGWLIAVEPSDNAPGPGALGLLRPDDTVAPIDSSALEGGPEHLVPHGSSGALGITDRRELFWLDAERGITRTASAALPADYRLVAGRDGTTLASGPGPTLEVSTADGTTRPLAGAPGNVRRLALARRDRIAAIVEGAIRVYDGTGWTDEHIDEAFLEIGAPRLSVTEEGMGFASPAGVMIRDEATRTWRLLGNPFGAVQARVVAVIGPGRLLVFGATGTGAIWDGAGWCDLATGLNTPIAWVGLGSQGRTAVALSKIATIESGPYVLRVSLK